MLALYNPHSQDFIFKPLSFMLVKRRALQKYIYLQKTLMQDNRINIYVDYTESSLISVDTLNKLPFFFRKFFIDIELFFWVRLNNLTQKVKFIKSKEFGLFSLFAFSYKSAINLDKNRVENLLKFKKLYFHLSHYMIRTSDKFRFFEMVKERLVLCGDSDCSNNIYYKRFKKDMKIDFIVISFLPQDRFLSKTEFNARSQKIIATGSFHNLFKEKPKKFYEDFLNFFNMPTYHYIRKDLYESMPNNMDIFISPYRQNAKHKLDISQKKYFSFDIVGEYNSHKFAAIGDEITGFIAIGTFEAMACGCVVFCVKRCVEGLGMKPFIHFVPYDGSVDDLLNQYEKIKKNDKMLEGISQNAVKFIVDLKEKNTKNILGLNR